MRRILLLLVAFLAIAAAPQDAQRVRDAMTPSPDLEALREIGPRAMPHLIAMYRAGDEAQRTAIAETFYNLGWKSEEAKAALMEDIATSNRSLRLQVQWALGRVSDDDIVVDTLARIMQSDGNALFRDKAACALAYDQIHLTEEQKVRLYGKVIHALRDPKPQVRRIAAQVLKIHLGQSKGFNPNAPEEEREKAVRAWERWLEEYASNL